MTVNLSIRHRSRRCACVRTAGFTLIELMIVVAVVAILSAIAYPSYVEHVRRGYRSECTTSLTLAMQAQERYYASNNEYTATITAAYQNHSGNSGAAQAACDLRAAACGRAGTTDCIRITATTKKGDTKCSLMTLDSTNSRGAKDTRAADQTALCWK